MVIVSVLLCFMGGYLILGRVPEQLKSSVYRSSRRVAGSVYVICALHIVSSLLFDLRLLGSNMAPVTCITTYYLMAILLAWSFTRLVGDRYYFRGRRVLLYLALWAVYTAALMGLVAYLDDEKGKICVVVAAVVYLIIVGLIVYLFKKAYKTALLRAEHYYSESVEHIISWIDKSVHHLVILGFLGGASAFCPPIGVVFFAIYALSVLIYIFSSFIIMMIDIPELMVTGAVAVEEMVVDNDNIDRLDDDDDSLADVTISAEVAHMLEAKLSDWVEKKSYLTVGISVMNMASEMCTNRTYLSRYVNVKYGMSFREWVLSLRVEEAKRLLLESDGRLQISQIASRVGFASPASFTRAFTRSEGVAPMKWRDLNYKL